MNIYLLLVTLLCAVTSCVALPDGAPPTACSSLLPHHGAGKISPQYSNPPYTVAAEKIGENKVKVTISSPSDEEIQGFILQARSAVDRNKFIAGEFKTSEMSKGIDCHAQKQSALTHTSADPKTQVTTEWTANAVNEDVIFRATVAKSYHEFWEKIDSEPVTIRTDHEMPSTEDNSDAHSIYDSCLKSKGCFGIPQKCVDKGNCDVLLTYEKSPSGIKFVMHGSLNEAEYMAVGLSDDNEMGDDFVTECLRVGSDVKLRNSWNVGKSNTRTTEASWEYNWTVDSGLTECVWTQPTVTTFGNRTYNLAKNKYYVLLAKGPVENGKLMYHNKEHRGPSHEPVDFFATSDSDHGTTEFRHEPTGSSTGKQTVTPTSPSSSSQLSSSLFWVIFFGVFYAGGKNVLKGLV